MVARSPAATPGTLARTTVSDARRRAARAGKPVAAERQAEERDRGADGAQGSDALAEPEEGEEAAGDRDEQDVGRDGRDAAEGDRCRPPRVGEVDREDH